MGDVVQEIMEDMVPEFDDMARKRLFAQEEIKEIIRKRRDYEYKINRRQSEKNEYIRCIQYECALDKLRLKRKTRMGIGKKSKASISDYAIQKRVNFTYDRLLRKWKGDVELWKNYIKHCIDQGAVKMLSIAFGRALQYNPRHADLWIQASSWHFDEDQNIKTARVMCQRGLRMIPESRQLWAHYLRLELSFIDKVTKRKRLIADDYPDAETPGGGAGAVGSHDGDMIDAGDATSAMRLATMKIGSVIIKNATAAMPTDLELRMLLAGVCADFADTESLEEQLYVSMVERFSENTAVWTAYAQRAMVRTRQRQARGEQLMGAVVAKAFGTAVATFEAGVVSHPQTPAVWEAFAQFCREDCLHADQDANSDAIKRLLAVYKRAQAQLQEQCPGSLLLARCSDLGMLGQQSEAAAVASAAVFHCSDLRLVQMHLALTAKVALQSPHAAGSATTVFRKCLVSLQSSSDTMQESGSLASLWYAMLEFLIINGSR
jgi:U3 small nucleolar RNA-associated protein 6